MPLEMLGRTLYPPQVPQEVEIPEYRVFDLLEKSAREFPARDAIVFYTARWTYQKLWDDVNRFARLLQDRGVGPGDRVALMLPNCPQYVIAYFGILRAGGIVVQLNPLLVERELQALLEDSGSRVLVVYDAVVPRVEAIRQNTAALDWLLGVSLTGTAASSSAEDFWTALASASDADPEPVAVSAGDIAVLQYTGGTTGRAKGAMLTHRNCVANVLQTRYFGEFYPGEEVVLGVIPLFHVYGMTVVMNLGLHLGGTLVLLPRFDPREAAQMVGQHRVTLWPGVPTMYIALLQVPDLDNDAISSIRICNSGSAPMPIDVMKQFEERTGGAILEGYGLSETSPVTHGHAQWMTRKPGTVGIAVPSTEFRIVDPKSLIDVPVGELGEVWVRGPQVMKGYWNHPEATEQTLVDGGEWLRTGDLGYCDADGYLTLMDRLKDLIIASGFNVYPREIEEVLYEHPDVLEAVVVGAPDPYRGETVRAVIVKKPGSDLTQSALQEYLADRLASYKRPKIIEFRSDLPKTAVGKILRRVVRDEPVQNG